MMKTQTKTFTFFLKDESIHEVEGETANYAFCVLCDNLGKSWTWLRPKLKLCLMLDTKP